MDIGSSFSLCYSEKEGQNSILSKFPVTSGTSSDLWVQLWYFWGKAVLWEMRAWWVLCCAGSLRRCLEWLQTKPEHHLDIESYSSFKGEPKQVNLLWHIPSFGRRTFFIFHKLEHLGIVKRTHWVAEEKSASDKPCLVRQRFKKNIKRILNEQKDHM